MSTENLKTGLQEAGPWKADHPLEQADVNGQAYHSDELELALLPNPALYRLHSLQSRTQLNTPVVQNAWQLPERVNESSGQDPSVLCLAPNEWLFFSEYLRPDLLQQQLLLSLGTVLNPRLSSLLDQSAAFAVFRLSGPAASWVLSKCCGLDFRSANRQGQHCCRTRLTQAPAILHYHRCNNGSGNGYGTFVFDVLVERSLARYSWQLLHRQLPHAQELFQQFGPLV